MIKVFTNVRVAAKQKYQQDINIPWTQVVFTYSTTNMEEGISMNDDIITGGRVIDHEMIYTILQYILSELFAQFE